MQIYTNLPNCNSEEKQISLLHSKNIVFSAICPVEKPARKITEIRIFFDNGTYETFRPDK